MQRRGLAAGTGNLDKTIEIVILAMIAAFLGLRLYSVLGRRAEREEQPRLEPKADAPPRPLVPEQPGGQGVQPAQRAMVPGVTPVIERGLREIAAADRRFDMLAFLDGAKSAYRMVLEAFWKGDRAALTKLCDHDVLAGFNAAIDARLAAGETLDNRLVRIDDVVIVAASYQAPYARVAVRFIADIAAVTRNAEGQVVAGSLNDAVEARDLWTFSRDVRAESPDWLVDETDEG
jgi:predicted lipid-binding transport protein (Tim44 family)